jgi:SH3-like domain-containing protein
VRAGPGVRYPVKWVFVQRNLPVEITAEYETWRKVRDSTGAEGWVHRAMLFGRRNVLVIDKQATMRRQPQDDSPAIARLNPGMVVRLEKCGAIWCNVSVQGYEGWLRRAEVWGLYLDEQPK